MAKTFPVGHMRVNPNNFMTEVWDGKTWVTQGSAVTTGAYNYPNSVSTLSSVKPTFSATERELIFEFLKQNMRVAEYIDKNGKVSTVQLEMRAGEGFVWEQVKREKTYNSL